MLYEPVTLIAITPLFVTFASQEARSLGFLLAGLCAALAAVLVTLDLRGAGGVDRLWLLALLGINLWLLVVGLGGSLLQVC